MSRYISFQWLPDSVHFIPVVARSFIFFQAGLSRPVYRLPPSDRTTAAACTSNPSYPSFLSIQFTMEHHDLARRQAQNPRLLLIQILIDALLQGTLTRADLVLFQDVAWCWCSECSPPRALHSGIWCDYPFYVVNSVNSGYIGAYANPTQSR